ncbi:MAG: uL15 family ribosomal protein, partial [Anaeroplasmataceae bacterium]|nr:uL15 family ribosomal protein [Anaeroplasmataceae bacterium]
TQQIILICGIVAVVVIAIGVLAFFLVRNSKKKKAAPKAEPQVKIEPIKEEVVEAKPEPKEEEKELSTPLEDVEDDKEEDFQVEEEPEKVVQVVNGRKVFVQFNYSFKAKLILASPEVQQQYRDILNFVRPFGVKTSLSWKQERIYLGRNTFAMLVFKGKKLCVAYAFDPKRFEGTKYHVRDLSEVKRFAKTPTLMKITSERKFKYVLELLNLIFTENDLEEEDYEGPAIVIPKQTRDELIEEKLIKVYTSEEVTEGTIVEQANVGEIIRKNVTINEAKQLITDDSALEYVQVEEDSSINKSYNKKDIINIDVLSKNFNADDLVNLESLKEKKLISSKVDYIKVLARGVLDKPLIIEAQDYSIDAIKMIVLTGGEVRKVK